jgi:hypothetical protein
MPDNPKNVKLDGIVTQQFALTPPFMGVLKRPHRKVTVFNGLSAHWSPCATSENRYHGYASSRRPQHPHESGCEWDVAHT